MVGGASWPLLTSRLSSAAGLSAADTFGAVAPAASVALSVLLALLCLCMLTVLAPYTLTGVVYSI